MGLGTGQPCQGAGAQSSEGHNQTCLLRSLKEGTTGGHLVKGMLPGGRVQVSASGQATRPASHWLSPLFLCLLLPPSTHPPTHLLPGDNQDAEETEGRLRVSRLWREIDFPPATRPSGSHLTSLSRCSAPLKMQTTFLPPGAVVRAQQVISVTGGGGRAGGCRRRHPPGRGLRAALRPRPGQRLRVQAIGGVRM